MSEAFLCEAVRTPIGRYGGALASVRPDDLGAHVVRQVMSRAPGLDGSVIEDIYLGCANQSGEDNRNVARFAGLLAGLPDTFGASTLNRLCGSGLDAVLLASRAIKTGEADVMIAGGVESMSRAPFVMPKANAAYGRNMELFDTTMGWRFINKAFKAQFGTDTMPETAENVAEDFQITREAQDAFALRSQERAASAQTSGRFSQEIAPVIIPQRKGDPVVVDKDEHLRLTSLEKLAALPAPFKEGGSVTAGNASGINDGAAAMIVASEKAIEKYDLKPKARIMGGAVAGVPPRIMGIGPAPASEKLLARLGLSVSMIDIIELNEAFAAQALATTRRLGLLDDAEHVNPNGGAIALGHPLGMSGARLAMTASIELQEREAKYALCAMCIGVGQGIALALERV